MYFAASTLWTAVFGLVGVLITASATLFGIWWKHVLEGKAKEKAQSNAVHATRVIRSALALAFDSLAVKRLLLVRVDCDKDTLLDENASFYLSVLEEERRDPLPSLASMMQLYKMDEEYIKRIVHPLLKGTEVISVRTETLGPSTIKNQFMAHNIVSADFCTVLRVADHIWAIAVHHTEENVHSPLYLSTLDTLRHTLQHTLRQSPAAGL